MTRAERAAAAVNAEGESEALALNDSAVLVRCPDGYEFTMRWRQDGTVFVDVPTDTCVGQHALTPGGAR